MPKLKKRSDGYYCAWYKGKQFLGKTETEAKRKRDNYRFECEKGIKIEKEVTVFDLASEWLPVAKASASQTTYNQYATIMEKLTGVIGDKLVSTVSPADIKKVWLEYVGKSQSYINKANFLYKSFFQFAMENKYCGLNPVTSQSAKPHKGTRGTHRALTKEEITLIETVPHRVRPAAMFMLKAGLRRGEVLALRKSDIVDDRIMVTKAIRFVNNRPVIDRTKNESSEREVPLFATLKPVYDELEDYVLPDDNGGICSETAFVRAWESYLSDLSASVNGCQKRWYHLTKQWKEEHPQEYIHYLELKAKGKTDEAEAYRLTGWKEISFRPHDLRHTFVTVGRDKGVDTKTMMSWCGHSSERMILEIYDHVTEERLKKMIELMDD